MIAQTYQQYSDHFDIVYRALNGGLPVEHAMKYGYPITVHGQYIPGHPELDPKKPHPHCHFEPPKPSPHYLFDMYRFGMQFGPQFDPSQHGYAYGRPNQGYGNWLNGKPRLPEPDWPQLKPNGLRYKPY